MISHITLAEGLFYAEQYGYISTSGNRLDKIVDAAADAYPHPIDLPKNLSDADVAYIKRELNKRGYMVK